MGSIGKLADGGQAAQGAEDPSMADILASIRRIMADEGADAGADAGAGREPAGADGVARAGGTGHHEDVIVLDRSMMVQPPAVPEAPDTIHPPGTESTVRMTQQEIEAHAAGVDLPGETHGETTAAAPEPNPMSGTDHVSSTATLSSDAPLSEREAKAWRPAPPALAEADTVSAAASSITTLARSVAAERTAAIQRNGLSIEDVVREEVRPLLKAWLDTHLPGLVERLVQAEIERVVNRATF